MNISVYWTKFSSWLLVVVKRNLVDQQCFCSAKKKTEKKQYYENIVHIKMKEHGRHKV